MRMTENEAIKRIKMCIGLSPSERILSAFKLISEALEELEQYRTIGTVEELEQYRTIGTVEECSMAVERMKLKKPNIEQRRLVDCVGIPHDITVKICPACGQQLEKVRFRKYPCECGQAIDWSEENE